MKDAYGNVVAVVNGSNVVVQYRYDAWGNCTEVNKNANDPFAGVNPIRYRSYYLDLETSLYYLQNRYYDPEIGAFISPDSTEYLDPESIGGLNLYAYCNNNPVMYYDPSGHIGFLATVLIGAFIGGVTGALFNVGKQFVTNGWSFNNVDWGSAINSFFVGTALGFSLAMGVTVLGPAIAGVAAKTSLSAFKAFLISSTVSFGAGALGYSVQELLSGRTPDFGKVLMHGGFVML